MAKNGNEIKMYPVYELVCCHEWYNGICNSCGLQADLTVIEIVFDMVEWVTSIELESVTLADHMCIIFTQLHPWLLYK